MLIKTLESELSVAVAEYLVPEGFKRYHDQEFQKPYPWGKAAIHLSFIEHENDFDVTVDVAIRFESLETLVNKNAKGLTEKEKKNTYSLGAELGNLTGASPMRWTVISQADIKRVARQISEKIATTAIPYIETYSQPKRALEILSGDEQGAWLHSPIHGERAKRAIGLAWLSGEQQIFDNLVDSKRTFLQARNDFGLGDFEEFLKSLNA